MLKNVKNLDLSKISNTPSTPFKMGSRRGLYFDVNSIADESCNLDPRFLAAAERLDLIYRSLCAILFNFVPNSGHPGGSTSSGRFVQSLLFNTMDYDFTNPDRMDSDIISYAAGHKAMGLYAAWALRNECVRISHPELMPSTKLQFRLEDLLGFRKNPTTSTPLFKKYNSAALDGHPSPATPFVKLCTGASGVGDASSFGLALGAMDTYGSEHAPWVHVIEGEGGLTPGRVYEMLATAATTQLHNIVMHLDWNQASIDSNKVCREGEHPGDYVQWSPTELFYVNDWNVIWVPEGFNFKQILKAQQLATSKINHQPTAIVYRTVKGWKYGIEGKSSHGAGHAFCSDGFYNFLSNFENEFGLKFPRYTGDKAADKVEQNFYDCLSVVREALEKNNDVATVMGDGIASARTRLEKKALKPRSDVPNLEILYSDPSISATNIPPELQLKPGASVALRGALGDVMGYLDRKTNGAIIASAADLFDSTSISAVNKGFAPGFYNAVSNPNSRLITTGGICEDGMGGFLSGLSSFGTHIGIGSSYGAFIAALQHVSARLHAIGQQTRSHATGEPQRPFIIVCAHAGPKTGEDGPTHADPQALQLMQENFCKGTMITLTPWDAQEMWPLMVTALRARPAVITVFVTRPAEAVIDREKFKVPAATASTTGVYALRKAAPGKKSATIVLQGNGVASAFITDVLPVLDEKGISLNVYYIASAEIFDSLSEAEQEKIFPRAQYAEAMGITEFTLPTMYRWITSAEGRKHTRYPLMHGHYLGSGQGAKVFEEAQLDGKEQLKAVMEYLKARGIE